MVPNFSITRLFCIALLQTSYALVLRRHSEFGRTPYPEVSSKFRKAELSLKSNQDTGSLFGAAHRCQYSKRRHPISSKEGGFRSSTKLYSLAKTTIDALLEPGNKNSLTKAYQRGSYLFLSLAAILFLIPDRTFTVLRASKFGGAAGYALAGGLCHIFAGANEKDRLSSDTYVRLNLGLLGFSAISFFFVPAEAGFFFSSPPAIFLSLILTLSRLYGVLVSFVGWKRGVDPSGGSSVQELFDEVKEGTIASVKGLRVQDPKKALAYRNCLVLAVLGIFSSIMEAQFKYKFREALQISWFEVSLNGSAVSRLFMIATIIYTLKDAAERDRLSGTTFIQLNFMVGAWALIVALGQARHPAGFALYRGVEMFAFSVPFITKGWKALILKEKEKRGDVQP